MNVKQLRDALKDLPDDMEVIMEKDSEGNGYSPLSGSSSDYLYVPDSRWSGDVYYLKYPAEDHGMSESDWETMKKKLSPVLVLQPAN